MKEILPTHLAIIMDGNGRWARKRFKNRIFGHKQGIRTVKKVVEYCAHRGIQYLTLYTFSSENWRRPLQEVAGLMALLKEYLKKEASWLVDMDIRLRMIGDRSRMPGDVIAVVNEVENQTSASRGMSLNIALSYGGRDEIVRAVRCVFRDREKNGGAADEIEETDIAAHLDTRGQPDPDLVIRTSGELRVSNFLIWQTAYAEFYFTETLWPDFTTDELEQALKSYMNRERRFGAV